VKVCDMLDVVKYTVAKTAAFKISNVFVLHGYIHFVVFQIQWGTSVEFN